MYMENTRKQHKQNSIAARQRIRRKKAAKKLDSVPPIQKQPEDRIWNGSRHKGKPLRDLPMRYLMAQAKKAKKFERGFLMDEIARRNNVKNT